jgi:hypothetical protein
VQQRLQQAPVQVQRLAQRRALGAQAPAIGRVLRITGDGRAALPVRVASTPQPTPQ